MADGSVVIDTKIDTSGVEKGMEDIKKTLVSIAENVKSISENFEKMINGLTSGSGTANNSVSNLNKNLERTADSGKKAAKELKINTDYYAIENYDYKKTFPWDFIEIKPGKEFLISESQRLLK